MKKSNIMKKYIPWSIRVLISIFFLVSAYAKLYPSPYTALTLFEGKQLTPLGFSTEMAAYFSRFIIGVEFILGIAILQPHYLKKFVVPSTITLLAVFSIHLSYELFVLGGSPNCGCFGELIPMTSGQSLIKNIVSIGLLVILFRMLPEDRPSKFSNLMILFLGVQLFMYAAFPIQHSGAGPKESKVNASEFEQVEDVIPQLITTSDTSKTINNSTDSAQQTVETPKPKAPTKVKSSYSQYTDYIPASVKLDEGRKLLCFFSSSCEHCMETAKKMTDLKKKMTGMPPMFIVFLDEGGGQADIDNFFNFAGSKYSYSSTTDMPKFYEMMGGWDFDVPCVNYLWNGNVRYKAWGIDDKAYTDKGLTDALLKLE